jgi:hypothetical protein
LLKAVPDFDYIHQNRQLTGVVLGAKPYHIALPSLTTEWIDHPGDESWVKAIQVSDHVGLRS